MVATQPPKKPVAKQDLHDLLLIKPSDGELVRIGVDKAGTPDPHRFKQLGVADPGRRQVMKLARLSDDATTPRGPGFSILPNRPDPDTSQMSCYLINPENLRAANPWTRAEWNEGEDDEDNSLALPFPEAFQTPGFEALLAGPKGQVFHVTVDASGSSSIARMTDDELGLQTELWSQLRSGLVAGTVQLYNDGEPGQVIPTFNVTAVMPREGAQ